MQIKRYKDAIADLVAGGYLERSKVSGPYQMPGGCYLTLVFEGHIVYVCYPR